MTKSPRKNVPDVGIELGAACMPSELASNRATAPGLTVNEVEIYETRSDRKKYMRLGLIELLVSAVCELSL